MAQEKDPHHAPPATEANNPAPRASPPSASIPPFAQEVVKGPVHEHASPVPPESDRAASVDAALQQFHALLQSRRDQLLVALRDGRNPLAASAHLRTLTDRIHAIVQAGKLPAKRSDDERFAFLRAVARRIVLEYRRRERALGLPRRRHVALVEVACDPDIDARLDAAHALRLLARLGPLLDEFVEYDERVNSGEPISTAERQRMWRRRRPAERYLERHGFVVEELLRRWRRRPPPTCPPVPAVE